MTFAFHLCRQSASARHAMRLVGVTLLLLLVACVRDNDAQIAQCRKDLARDLPAVAQDRRTFYFEHGDYMLACMKAGGFEHDVAPTKCNPDAGSIFENPYCYVPTSLWRRWLLRVEIFFTR